MKTNGATSTSLTQDLYSLFINHNNFDHVMKEVLGALRRGTVRHNSPILHISGPAGVGKTTIGKQLMRQYPVVKDGWQNVLEDGRSQISDHIPLLRFRLGDQPTVKNVSRAMLEKFRDPLYIKGDLFTLTDRIDKFTKSCGTIGYVVDDAHRMMDRNGIVTAEKLLDWFIDRREQNNVTLIFLGMGRLGYLIGEDLQVERRSNAELRLEPYPWWRAPGEDDLEGQAIFSGILRAMVSGAKIVLDETVALSKPLNIYRFWYISRGSAGLIKKLLERVAAQHDNDGRTDRNISMEDLQLASPKAFRLVENNMVNPFTSGFNLTHIPPPLQNDALPLDPPRRRRDKKTKADKARELEFYLTKK
jgi:hypothetical protein